MPVLKEFNHAYTSSDTYHVKSLTNKRVILNKTPMLDFDTINILVAINGSFKNKKCK